MSIAYTVALCTHNHVDRLRWTLADLVHVHPPGAAWEFLVIDNGSRDATPEVLASHTWPAGWNVRVVREEKLGLSNARNRAIAVARGMAWSTKRGSTLLSQIILLPLSRAPCSATNKPCT